MNLIRREDADHIGTPIGGQVKTDAFGCEYIYCYAVAEALINTPQVLTHGAFGAEVNGVEVAGTLARIVVPDNTIAASAYGWCAVRGPHDVVLTGAATATDGDAVKIHTDGKPVSDETPEVPVSVVDQFASVLEAKGTATAATIKCYLWGDKTVTWT